MIEVIPAVLPASFLELETALLRLRGVTSSIQLDVVDGRFVPNTTWPYTMGEEAEKIIAEEATNSRWRDFDIEVDLMVEDAAREAPKWVSAGASRLVVHAKSSGAGEALNALQHRRGEGRGLVSLGVALRAHDSPNALWPFEDLYDFVQVMGIDFEGSQGEPPDPHHRSIELIKKLRTEFPELSIGVDGGVRMENISKLVGAGVNRLVVGSLILAREDVDAAIREIIEEANRSSPERA